MHKEIKAKQETDFMIIKKIIKFFQKYNYKFKIYNYVFMVL